MDKLVKLVTAEEAKVLTNHYNNIYKYKTWKRINRLIKYTCRCGWFETHTDFYVSDEIIEDLRELGYLVKPYSYQTPGRIIISWGDNEWLKGKKRE